MDKLIRRMLDSLALIVSRDDVSIDKKKAAILDECSEDDLDYLKEFISWFKNDSL